MIFDGMRIRFLKNENKNQLKLKHFYEKITLKMKYVKIYKKISVDTIFNLIYSNVRE